MVLYALPALYALFIWWFSTGVIMYLDGLPGKTFKWSILGATLLMVFSLWGVYASRNDASMRGRLLRLHLRTARLGLAGNQLLHGVRHRHA